LMVSPPVVIVPSHHPHCDMSFYSS
jgi:hypothetical protein